MSCGCKSDVEILSSKASTAVDSSGSLLITPTVALSPENEQGIKILITNATPVGGVTLPVYITLDGANIPVYDKFGNIVYGNQIYNNMILRGYYGSNGLSGQAHYQLIKLPNRIYY